MKYKYDVILQNSLIKGEFSDLTSEFQYSLDWFPNYTIENVSPIKVHINIFSTLLIGFAWGIMDSPAGCNYLVLNHSKRN